jgi:hypothetical protein
VLRCPYLQRWWRAPRRRSWRRPSSSGGPS